MKVLQAEVKVTWIYTGKGIDTGKYKRQYKCL